MERCFLVNVLNSIEQLFIDNISTNVPNDVLNKFSKLVRVSGSEDEKKAFSYLESYLKEWGVQYIDHNPEIYLSIPKKAKIKVHLPIEKELNAKTPSFSVSTDGKWVTNELTYIYSGYGRNNFVSQDTSSSSNQVNGKIVLTEGLLSPAKVKRFSKMGASAILFISPGERIHEGTCTSNWGAPDLDNVHDEPDIPVLSVSKSDGEELAKLCDRGPVKISFQTTLDKGWYNCPLLDVFIQGTKEPENFVLLHGHLDSWHVGIGDNATGNAALLEMIRIFHKHRAKLKRSLRIVIWPGHSTGRYGGSTWFADRFGLELEENCIAQVNCDSPGCRWATSYKKMRWMSEAEDLCKQSIKDAVGQESAATRPTRAGDYSFNNIGITSFYMLSSVIPDSVLKEKGYYTVGGCGSNIEWHTEDDLLHIADMDILVKDIKVYVTTILRVINSAVHPFNFVVTVEEIIDTIMKYQSEAGAHFDLSSVLEEAKLLRQDMIDFYESINLTKDIATPEVQAINSTIRKLARDLVLVNYSTKGKFKHDPAFEVGPLPDLAYVKELKILEPEEHFYKVLQTHLTRGKNRVIWAFRQARDTINSQR